MIWLSEKETLIKRSNILCLILWLLISCSLFAQSTGELNLNVDWRFSKGDQPGAFRTDFDDSGWRIVDVPHDWSIEDLNGQSNPFIESAEGQWNVGYTKGGVAWYRKGFSLDSTVVDKVIHLQFDGVYMNADVWVNGYHAGSRAYGYSTFRMDVTPFIRPDTENVIAVEVKNIGRNSRWYSGSGIYRPVHLKILNPVHIDLWGPFVRSFDISETSANIEVNTKIINASQNQTSLSLRSEIRNPKGDVVTSLTSRAVAGADKETEKINILKIKNPSLWSLDSPSLYTLVQDVFINEKRVDHRETYFGIRSLYFSAEEGFLLNGESTLLKGACIHHDNYMLGSAACDRAEERKVQILKSAGFNAIRTSHNPPSQALLDACDREGMLVIDESFDQWSLHKANHYQDYGRHFQEWWQKDLESMILRDRNHPSVIMWSIGNEIPEQGSETGTVLAKRLASYVKSLDDTRPVTMGVNHAGPHMDVFFQELDIVGYNYQIDHYISDHERVPNRIAYGSESFPRDAFRYWKMVEELPYIIGDFVWTGWDYLGEASIGWNGFAQGWKRLGYFPWHGACCGDLDLTGLKRPAAYYRDVLWNTGNNKVSMFVKSPEPSLKPAPDSSWIDFWTYADVHPCWTWPGQEGKEIEVIVYSACEEAELFLNGKSLGRKVTAENTEYTQKWMVPYKPGELTATGYIDGKKEAEWTIRTAGKPAQIKLSHDRQTIDADGSDLVYLTAELFDVNGNRVYHWDEDELLHFDIQGSGKLAGVGNGNPACQESFQQPQRMTFRGRCVLVVKSTKDAGEISVDVSADGLKSDTVLIQTLKKDN